MANKSKQAGIEIKTSTIQRVLIASLGVPILILVGIAIFNISETANYGRFYPPTGSVVDVGEGRRMHITCIGETQQGTPTIILDAGWGEWSIHMNDLQEAMSADTRVCAYDRPGYGWSDPSPNADPGAIADDLHFLLEATGEQPPYLLIGMDYAGWNSLIYADRYPDEIKGVALVNTLHPDYASRLPEAFVDGYEQARTRWARNRLNRARLGWLRFGGWLDDPALHGVDEFAYNAAMLRAQSYQAMVREAESREVGAAQVAGIGKLDEDIFLVMISTEFSLDPDFVPTVYPIDYHADLWDILAEELFLIADLSIHYTLNGLAYDFYTADPALLMELAYEAGEINLDHEH